MICLSQITKEFKTPTANTRRIHSPAPVRMKLRLEVQPSGNANVKGTPTTSAKDRAISAKTDN